jgi:predicted DNA-binding protein (UPF0251 family)
MVPDKYEHCKSHRLVPSVKEAVDEARRWEALNFARAGMNDREIGERMGVTRQAVAKLLNKALAELAPNLEEVEHNRTLRRTQLNRLLAAVWPRATANPPDLEAWDRAHKLIGSLMKLDGLTTHRVEHTGPAGGPIPLGHVAREDEAEVLELLSQAIARKRALAIEV